MNGDIDTRPELEEYLAKVRSALSDLPEDELAEIMEDVEPNVYEVHAETGTIEELTARLGTPQAYADELRSAGGYPPPPSGTPRAAGRTLLARYVLWITGLTVVVAFISGVASGREYDAGHYVLLVFFGLLMVPAVAVLFAGKVSRQDVEGLGEYQAALRLGRSIAGALPPNVVTFLRGAQPAWWLVRIVVLALALLAALSARSGGFLVLAGVLALLVWGGLRVGTDRRWLAVMTPANAFVAGVAIALAYLVIAEADDSSTPYYGPYSYSGSGLYYEGRQLSNVYAVDAEGKAIPEFYLYDETGAPLRTATVVCDNSGQYDRDATNRYPQPSVDYGPYGCTQSTSMPFVPLPPSVSAGPTSTPASPAPSVTTSPSPTAPVTTPPATTAPVTTAPPTTG